MIFHIYNKMVLMLVKVRLAMQAENQRSWFFVERCGIADQSVYKGRRCDSVEAHAYIPNRFQDAMKQIGVKYKLINNTIFTLMFFGWFVNPALSQDMLTSLNLTGECKGCDFSESDFRIATFEGKSLICTNFKGAKLDNVKFIDSRVHGYFERVSMKNASFKGSTLEEVRVGFSFNRVDGASLLDGWCGIDSDDEHYLSLRPSESCIEMTGHAAFNTLRGRISGDKYGEPLLACETDMRGASFERSDVSGVIYKSILSGAKFLDITSEAFTGLVFNSSSGKKVEISWGNPMIVGEKLEFINSDFSNSRISSRKISHVNVKIYRSVFDDSILDNLAIKLALKSSFRGASLRGADLSGADLSGSDFTNADLTGANLSGVNIEGAIFCETIGPDGNLIYLGCP